MGSRWGETNTWKEENRGTPRASQRLKRQETGLEKRQRRHKVRKAQRLRRPGWGAVANAHVPLRSRGRRHGRVRQLAWFTRGDAGRVTAKFSRV